MCPCRVFHWLSHPAEGVDDGGGCACAGGRRYMRNSCTFSWCCCALKTVLKNKHQVLKKRPHCSTKKEEEKIVGKPREPPHKIQCNSHWMRELSLQIHFPSLLQTGSRVWPHSVPGVLFQTSWSCTCYSLCVEDRHFLLHKEHLLRLCSDLFFVTFSWHCPSLCYIVIRARVRAILPAE